MYFIYFVRIYYHLFKLGVFKVVDLKLEKLPSGVKARINVKYNTNKKIEYIHMVIDPTKSDINATIRHECRHVWQYLNFNCDIMRFWDIYSHKGEHLFRRLLALHEMDAIAYSRGYISQKESCPLSELSYQQLCSFESFHDIDLKCLEIMESHKLRAAIESEALSDGILLQLPYV